MEPVQRTAGTATFLHSPFATHARLAALAAGLLLTACVATAPPAAPPADPPPPPAAPAPPPRPPLPAVQGFAPAVDALAARVLAEAGKQGSGARRPIVFEPPLDAATGLATRAGRSMMERVAAVVRTQPRELELQPFTAEAVARSPLLLLGTLAAVDDDGETVGPRTSYRLCLAVADLASGRVMAQGFARAVLRDVDTAPTPTARDAPAWRPDEPILAQLRACEAALPGQPLEPAYREGIAVSALLAEAAEAYDANRHVQALELYQKAAAGPAGDQLRVYNGLYMANWSLRRRTHAAKAFGQVVDYGMRNGRIAVKLLFRPGSTAFVDDGRTSEPYAVWLEQIALAAMQRQSCLEVIGHASATGEPAVNDRLSARRAEQVVSLLLRRTPKLKDRVIATGAGSRQLVVGTGKDDLSDALDRRVELVPFAC